MSIIIFNMALDLLKEEPILAPTDNRSAVKWMNRNYVPTRDALLRQHPWNCALSRASLAVMSDAPAFGWTYQYQVPADCLRVLPLADLGKQNGRSTPFEYERRKILTNATAPLLIRYIGQIEEPEMDAMFKQSLAATLAGKAANFIAGKASYANQCVQMAKEATMAAQMVDALEGTPEESDTADWTDARFGDSA
jgi:hypothetical protein